LLTADAKQTVVVTGLDDTFHDEVQILTLFPKCISIKFVKNGWNEKAQQDKLGFVPLCKLCLEMPFGYAGVGGSWLSNRL